MAASDVITTEVIRFELVSAVEEIKRIFKRTTTLAVLYELNDFGISALDSDYQLIADAPGLPIFSGPFTYCARSCVDQLGVRNLAPGDVLVTTVPYDTGDQQVDAALVAPVFYRDEIIAYTCLKAHMGDLGAMDPYPTASTNIFQEGLILPAMWLYRRGELQENILHLIKANSRIPQTTAISFLAGSSAIRAGGQRIVAIAERYGTGPFRSAISEIIAHGEKMARTAVEAIPDGTWEIVDYMDNDGVGNDPVKISVKVTIRGGDFIVDLSNSAPQQRGPINSPFPGTLSALRYVIKALTTPNLPANEGHFKPLQVIAPPGSLFHALPPAATFLGGWPTMRLLDLVPAALAPAIPERVTAISGSDICGLMLAYFDSSTGRGDIGGGADAVGLGAASRRDGQNAVMHHSESCCCNVPVEVQESRVAVLIERYELWPNSGGPGKYRGGLGVRKDFRTLVPVTAISTLERTCASTVGGVAGGRSGWFNKAVFFPGTTRETSCGKKILELQADEKVSIFGGGGAGWGDPLERNPERVLEDVRSGYVTVPVAEKDYGVMVRERDGDFFADEVATNALRARLRNTHTSGIGHSLAH